MKLKYYLRGLGIGMLVTAVILSIASGEDSLSDEEIRARAASLGMVDSASLTLSEAQSLPSESRETVETVPESKEQAETPESSIAVESVEASESSVPAETMEIPESSLPAEPSEGSETATKESETPESDPLQQENMLDIEAQQGAASPSQAPKEPEPESAVQEKISITIPGGSSSYTVSKLLVEAGLVDDISDYDAYLCDNGYSRKIRVGTFQIPVGASQEEIAKIITGK